MSKTRAVRTAAVCGALIALTFVPVRAADARVTLHAGDGGTILYSPRDYSRTEPAVACWDHIEGRYGGNLQSGIEPEEIWVYWYRPALGDRYYDNTTRRYYYDRRFTKPVQIIERFVTNELTPVGPDEGWGEYADDITHSVPFYVSFLDVFDEVRPEIGDRFMVAPQGDDITNDAEIVDCRGPSATPQNLSTPFGMALPITLKGTDPTNDPLTFSVVQPPAHGTLTGTAPNVTYQPAAGYSGPDSFQFTADDGLGPSRSATVNITVGAAPTVDRVSVTLSGAVNLTISGDSTSAGIKVTKDAAGVSSIVGTAQVARAGGGTSRVTFDVHRVLGFPVHTGTITVKDGNRVVDTPVLFGSTVGTVGGAAGTARWLNFPTFPNLLYTMVWSVEDR